METKEKGVAITAVAEEAEMSPQALITLAIEKNVSVETMEKLMDLQDRWEIKKSKKQFDEAMASFQIDCPVIEKKKEVKNNSGMVLYSYAPLEVIVKETKNLLKKHGFNYSFKTKTEKDNMTVECIAKHIGGHSESSTMEVPTVGGTGIMSAPQKVASAMTFAKRYTFCNVFGIITADEDIDAKHGDTEVVADNIDIYRTKLEKCKDLEELKAVWASLPPQAKNEFEQIKEIKKAEFKKASK